MNKPRDKRASIRFGTRKIPVPGSRRQRVVVGSGLVAGGVVGFLPLVGFWMLPLGLLILSVDSKHVRRGRRKLEVKWGRWRKEQKAAQEGDPDGVATGPKRKGRE